MKLDELLSVADPSVGQASARLRAAVFAELEVPPARSWRGDVLWVVAACGLVASATAIALVAGGVASITHLTDRAAAIAGLLAIGAGCAFTSLAPRRRGRLLIGFALAASGMIGLVLSRQTASVNSLPAWVCTFTHFTVGLAPLGFGLSLLRKSAIDPIRAGLLGLAIGSTGAIVGELACEQSWTHVAIWHLGAWALLGAVATLVSRRLVPRSFAP
jgi:hypothetical protein